MSDNDWLPHMPPPVWALPINEDAKRWEDDADRIRSALRHDPGCIVRMDCFNEDDRDQIARRLSREDRRRVRFTWLTWPERPP